MVFYIELANPLPVRMVVKEKRGRYRYVGFYIESTTEFSRSPVKRAVYWVLGRNIRGLFTHFENNRGIVKCPLADMNMVVKALRSMNRVGGKEVRTTPLTSSGTIKQVKLRLKTHEAQLKLNAPELNTPEALF